LTETLDEYLAVRLATAGALARRELNRACKANGRPLHEVLLLIAAADRAGLTPSGLAERVGMQRSEASRVLDDLRQDGWLALAPHPYDDRSRAVRMRADGGAFVLAARPVLAGVDRQLRANLTPLRQKQLAVCLELLKGPRTPVEDALTGL
jgi:DNA-binding MarR family transcriptional regulator